jgi:dihydrofolate synthase/folylpolyglutamate synthase
MLAVLEQLYRAPVMWSTRSLSKIKAFLRSRGNPHHALRVLHVAWTNGKGSVCTMLAQVLQHTFGEHVWLFTSPHLVRINERIRTDGKEIPDSDLIRWTQWVIAKQAPEDPWTFFELMTLVAIYYFLEQKVAYVVMEVGVWGTHDTTNLWDTPIATFITSISDDHRQLLWPSMAQIQRNKMGIMKAWVPCYTSVDNPLMRYGAKKRHAVLHIVHDRVPTSLLGEHQEHNAALVYHALRDLGYDEKRLRTGLQQVYHSGRLQFLTPHILLDGAHNTEGILALRRYVESIQADYSSLTTIFATTKSVEHLNEFVHLLIQGDTNYVVSTTKFNKKTAPHFLFPVTEFVDMASVVACLKQPQEWLVVVYGSLYLIGGVLQVWESNPHPLPSRGTEVPTARSAL